MLQIAFIRLAEVEPDEIQAHMNDPRMREHMPLLDGDWDEAATKGFVQTKEASWHRDGLGHWAFLADGVYVGWGGFQKEGEDWDFALVLKPDAFGLGPAIARKAIAFARNDARIDYLTFLLAPTRRSLGALKRMGARPVGEIQYDGATLLKFRMETA